MPRNEPDLNAIKEAAVDAAAEFAATDVTERLEAVEQRIASIESIQEDTSKRELAGAELTEYIKELRGELRDLRSMRTIYGALCIGLIGVLGFILVALIFVSGSPLYTLPPYPAAIAVIALVTGIVVLALTLAKGVHRSSVEKGREDTTISVPHLISELAKHVRE